MQFACPTSPIPVLHYVYQLVRLDVAATVLTTATSPHTAATDDQGTCSFAIAASDIPNDKAEHRIGRFKIQLVRFLTFWAFGQYLHRAHPHSHASAGFD